MRKYFALAAFAAVFSVLGFWSARHEVADAAKTSPATGFTLHIDAEQHFVGHPKEIAHHWCKTVAAGMTECQLYDSDAVNAHLVGVETIVGPAVYKAFSASEQASWHYHKTEIPKINAKLPDLTPAEAKKVVAQISDSYGKVYVLWDPMASAQPVGSPTITVLK